MDLLSILKNVNWGFFRKQLVVWVTVISDPLGVVSKVNLRSNKAVTPALSFVGFVYLVTLLFAIPKMVLYQNIDVLSDPVIVIDFVLTGLAFLLLGLTLYAAGKLMGGSGYLLGSMIAGFYLTALWPVVQLTDYVLLIDLSRLVGPLGTSYLRAALFPVVVVGVIIFIVIKVSPVMGHVHAIGRLRATIAVLVQVFLMFVSYFLFLTPWFAKLAGKG